MTQATTAVEGVSLRLGGFSLRDIDLTVAPGQILVILGPNGAGKSVTLETIAGFHRPKAGRIVIGGRDVTDLPPERRRVGLLFQNFGLFPHLTVAANIVLGLRAGRKPAMRPHDPALAPLLARFHIDHLADRLPEDLSPGEKQRTALARALAMQPDLFMFDEPFSALDAQSRETLREELRAFLRETRIPAIFVTHDQADAAMLADRLAIMNHGAIVQEGPAADLFKAPANVFVADFVGIDNRLPGRVIGRAGDRWRIDVGGRLLLARDDRFAGETDANVFVCIRGEDVVLRGAGITECGNAATNRLTMRVVGVSGLGAFRKVALDGDFSLVAYLTRRDTEKLGLAPGNDTIVEIDPEAIHLLTDSGGNTIQWSRPDASTRA
ncbi:ABC transporter ATP-binding protein [Acidiphilium iwatense]|uniref:ABC transporter ATP-binding protein n=1 Tax=Acidiphilium iwatense TaxID=768198 RepID=A0ABS9DZY5_9PROT|nr:ABC transporter ATP-binding protein [Acidiphilium iwatense]MCF3946992.1 ABC transporter ATP-binding protein [Acidiphilium iwatense]